MRKADRAEARRQYAALSDEARDWSDADLEAAREACPNHLNFAELLHIGDLRLCTRAQWEIRQMIARMRAELMR